MELTIDKKTLIEIYNALCCLNVEIRDKQKRRAKYIQKLIVKFSNLMGYNKIKSFYCNCGNRLITEKEQRDKICKECI